LNGYPVVEDLRSADIMKVKTSISYRMGILAEDIDEAPGALWTRNIIEKARVQTAPSLSRIVVAVDPFAISTGDAACIVAAGRYGNGGVFVS